MPLFFWSLVMGFLITVSYLIPLFGQMALIGATPLLTFVTLSACRHISAGRPMLLNMWLEPLRDPDRRRRLLLLGLAYLFACMAGGFLATLPFLDQMFDLVQADGQIDATMVMAAMRGPFLTFAVIYVLLSALFWHAPALVGWHGIRLGQALFFSMVACWRNKWPFLLYGLSWAAIFLAMQMTGWMLTGLGLSPSAVQIILTPLNLFVAAILYCSFYPAYISVFGNNYDTPEEA
jgi:hypothetical protein